MRSDDIRQMVIDANQKALDLVSQLEKMDIDQTEVILYREQLRTGCEFWRNASPGFIHAWFAVSGE